MRITRKNLDDSIRQWNAQTEIGYPDIPRFRTQMSYGRMHIESADGAHLFKTGTTRECYDWFSAFREGYTWTMYHPNGNQ